MSSCAGRLLEAGAFGGGGLPCFGGGGGGPLGGGGGELFGGPRGGGGGAFRGGGGRLFGGGGGGAGRPGGGRTMVDVDAMVRLAERDASSGSLEGSIAVYGRCKPPAN